MNRFLMDEVDQRKLDNFAKALGENHELMTVIKFLNTYLDETGKLQLGHCMSIMYKQGYEDCIRDIWDDLPKINE